MNLTEACQSLGVEEHQLGTVIGQPAIKHIFRKLALKHHPDKVVKHQDENVDPHAFVQIKSSYDYILKYLDNHFEQPKKEDSPKESESKEKSEKRSSASECQQPKKEEDACQHDTPRGPRDDFDPCPMDVDPPDEKHEEAEIKDHQAEQQGKDDLQKNRVPRIHKPSQMRAILFAIIQIIGSSYHQLFSSADIFEFLKSNKLIVKYKKGDKIIAKNNEFLIIESSDGIIKSRIQSRMNEYTTYFCKACKGKYSLSQSAREAALTEFEKSK